MRNRVRLNTIPTDSNLPETAILIQEYNRRFEQVLTYIRVIPIPNRERCLSTGSTPISSPLASQE